MTTMSGGLGGVPRRLPPYAPGLARDFDPASGLYGVTPENNRVFASSLGAAAAGTGPCHDVILGASGEDGYDGATLRAPQSWPESYRQTLAQLGIPSGGTGMFPASDTNPSAFTADARIATTGAWSTLGGDFAFTGTNGATLTFTPDVGGGRLRTSYGAQSAAHTVKIGAAAAAPINPSGAATVDVYAPATVVPAATPVVITAGGTLSAFHVGTVGTVGYHKHNLARSSMGATIGGAGQFGTDAEGAWDPTIAPNYYSPAPAAYAMLTAAGIQAHRLTIALGGNDLARGKTGAQVIASLPAIIAAVPKVAGATIRLVLTWQLGIISDAAWEDFARRLYAFADANGYQLADWRYSLGNAAAMLAAGVLGPDDQHTLPGVWSNFGRKLALADARAA